MADREYDVVVVGGSLAGCAAARLLALHGARVAVVEKRPELDAYKVVCTHNIQAGAVPAIERLGIGPALRDAGAVRAQTDIWTRYGWIRPPDRGLPSLNLRRSVLDPIVRRQAIDTPGVDYLPGLTAVGLEGDEQVEGVRVSGQREKERTLSARLVVAADGRDSRVARMAGVPGRVRPHMRFCYFSYFRDVPLRDPNRGMVWFGDPDLAYLHPNEEGVSMVAVTPAKRRLDEFRGDPESAVRAHFRSLADAPSLDGARPVAKWFGKLEMPNSVRPAAARGMAFVGDAAQASDPIFGAGCGWAFQSADWLAEEVGPALHGSDRDLGRALKAYGRRHRRELGAHHWLISDYSSARRFSPVEKLIYSAAARDAELAGRVEDFSTRSIGGIAGTRRMVSRAASVRLGLAG
ncbi:MAG TPA: NAD(P)/FAD-dependent oxidoreductase [Solirubrobacterales bacterium]